MGVDAKHGDVVTGGWPDRRFSKLVGARHPIVAAPMAGAGGPALAIAAIAGGALGSLPGAIRSPEQLRGDVAAVRGSVAGPLNLNFFCHDLPPPPDERAWRAALAPFYAAEGVVPQDEAPPLRRPFDAIAVALIEELRPEVVSFQFGLPEAALLDRVRATGAVILGNATSVAEARSLAARGVDAVIVQGAEAGGHAGWFLDAHRPVALRELLPAVVAAVDLPVIAAGGIVDARDIADALSAGAAGVQIGTAYLATPESLAAAPHRALLGTPASGDAVFTTLFSGREARGIRNRLIDQLGPTHPAVPPFPYATAALGPLRAVAERDGRGDYSPMWAGAGAPRVRTEPAQALTERLAAETFALLETV